MKDILKEIISISQLRSDNACTNPKESNLLTELDSLEGLDSNELLIKLAKIYFSKNPNVYSSGNNARLYTAPESEAIAGGLIALLGNNSGGTYKSNPVGSIIAKKVFDFFIKDVVGYADGEAIDTSGGMAANAMAIHVARQKFKPNAKEHGNEDMKFVLLTSDQSHYSQEGGVNRAGLGTNNIQYIPTDDHGAMDLVELKKAIEYYTNDNYCIVVGSTLGTTVLGAMDNISEIDYLCSSYKKIWHHVDASWGGPIVISRKSILALNLNKADSVTFDTHKAFRSTMACGIFVTRHVDLLKGANFSYGGEKYLYNKRVNPFDNGVRSLECGKSDRTLSFGALLMSREKYGLSNMINKNLSRTDEFVAMVRRSDDIILMHTPQYLNVCIQVVSPFIEITNSKYTQKIQEYLLDQRSSKVMIELCKDTKSNSYVLRCILNNPKMDSLAMHMIISEIVSAKTKIVI